jgi:phospholipid/cholesterol/gamma-HCH transport system permease protein
VNVVDRVRQVLALLGDMIVFQGRAVVALVTPPFEPREALRQLYELGVRSVPLIGASGFAIGVVLSMHTRASLERFGAEALIPAGLAMSLVRETGPLTCALLLSGRVGAGIGAELGAMKVTEQIDALESLAVDSFRYLVVTRVVACLIALPVLTTLMNFMGIVGGFVAESTISGMTFTLYFDRAIGGLDFADIVPSTLKTIVFGFIIATVASYLGVNTTRGTEGVGKASTQAVVASSIAVIVVNVVLVKMIFFLLPGGVL